MKRYLTTEEVTALGLIIENTTWDTEKELKEIFGDYCETIVLSNVSEHEGKYYLEYSEVFLKYKGFLLKPYKEYGKTNYRFFAPRNKYNNLINYRNTNPIPNKIGKPTDNKLQEWVDYLKNEIKEREDYYNSVQSKIETFLKSLKPFEVKWYNNNTRGEIVKNGIKYSFSIDYGSGGVFQKIGICYTVKENLSSFVKLSENKL